LFWTAPIDDNLINVDADRGRARFRARRMALADYGNFFNSIAPPSGQQPPIPSHVSFDVRWLGGGRPTTVHDTTFDFAGTFLDDGPPQPGPITIDFTAQHDGSNVVYRSDPVGQMVVSGGVGRERNGIFFG
jgi:hypothetical protein